MLDVRAAHADTVFMSVIMSAQKFVLMSRLPDLLGALEGLGGLEVLRQAPGGEVTVRMTAERACALQLEIPGLTVEAAGPVRPA